jgi:hypothetical protein
LGGALGVWDPQQNRTVENYRHIVKNQSVVSLAWEPESGLIFGGSGNYGGGGTRAVENEARFFAFDPRQQTKVFETSFVPGGHNYPATCASRGKVYTTAGDQLLVFDPATMKVIQTIRLPGPQVDISLEPLSDGRLVGLTTSSVYVYDPARGEIVHTAPTPAPVRCGFALWNGAVYFGSNAQLWRYRLPLPVSHTDRELPP